VAINVLLAFIVKHLVTEEAISFFRVVQQKDTRSTLYKPEASLCFSSEGVSAKRKRLLV